MGQCLEMELIWALGKIVTGSTLLGVVSVGPIRRMACPRHTLVTNLSMSSVEDSIIQRISKLYNTRFFRSFGRSKSDLIISMSAN